jgi:hypothetical protein
VEFWTMRDEPAGTRRGRPRRGLQLLLIPLDLVVGLVILLDEMVRPLYRPLLRWFSGLQIVARAERWIGSLPPYGALAALAVPFAIAEPLKLLSLVLLARGALWPGLVTMGIAHLGSFLLVERVYHAGRAQLLTITWFAWCIGWLDTIRRTILDRIKATAAFRRMAELGAALRQRARYWLLRGRIWWARRR